MHFVQLPRPRFVTGYGDRSPFWPVMRSGCQTSFTAAAFLYQPSYLRSTAGVFFHETMSSPEWCPGLNSIIEPGNQKAVATFTDVSRLLPIARAASLTTGVCFFVCALHCGLQRLHPGGHRMLQYCAVRPIAALRSSQTLHVCSLNAMDTNTLFNALCSLNGRFTALHAV